MPGAQTNGYGGTGSGRQLDTLKEGVAVIHGGAGENGHGGVDGNGNGNGNGNDGDANGNRNDENSARGQSTLR